MTMAKSKRILKYFIGLLLLFHVVVASGQQGSSVQPLLLKGKSVWQVGVQIGPDFFYGDLNPYKVGISGTVSIAGGAFVIRELSPVFSVRGQVLGGGLNGKKGVSSGGYQILKKFKGGFVELNVNGIINFSNLFSKPKPSRKVSVYGTLGIGMINWNTLQTDYMEDAIVGSVPNPRQWRTAAVFPFGAGAIFRITDRISLSGEWTFRMITSDLVDQVKGGFKLDVYDYLSFGVSYSLGKSGNPRSNKLRDYPYYSTPSVIPQPVMVMPVVPVQAEQHFSPAENFEYTVQIFAFEKKSYSTEWIRKKYKIEQPVRKEQEGNLTRYVIDRFTNMATAREWRDRMVMKGIRDAFVVAYKDGKRHHTVTAGD